MFLVILFISVIVTIIWIKTLRKFDGNARLKNNDYAVEAFFLYGLLSIPLVFILSYIVSPLLSPVTSEFPLMHQILEVGLIEETSKFLIFYLAAVRTSSIKEPRDGVIHAASVGLAFAIIENIFYSVYGIQVLVMRSVLTTVGHMTYAAVWGYAAGVVIYTWKARDYRYSRAVVVGALGAAAVFHGLYNYFLLIDMFGLALIVDVVTLIIAVSSLSYLQKLSPYRKFSYKEYRSAIPQLRAALASNPDNFALNKRIALHYIKAGRFETAEKHLAKASRAHPRELSSKFYHSILQSLSGNPEEAERGRTRLSRVSEKIPRHSLWKLLLEAERLFAGHPSQEDLSQFITWELEKKRDGQQILLDRLDHRPMYSKLERKEKPVPRTQPSRSAAPRRADRFGRAGRPSSTGQAAGRRGYSRTELPNPQESRSDSHETAKKRRAAGRIIEAKRRELEGN